MSAYFSAFKTIGKVLKGNKSKVSPTIKSVKPSVPKTKAEKVKSKLKILKQRTKGSQAKLDQNLFETEQASKKRKEFKKGSSKGKVPTTPKEKAFGMLSVKAKRDNNPNITLTDKIVGATKA